MKKVAIIAISFYFSLLASGFQLPLSLRKYGGNGREGRVFGGDQETKEERKKQAKEDLCSQTTPEQLSSPYSLASEPSPKSAESVYIESALDRRSETTQSLPRKSITEMKKLVSEFVPRKYEAPFWATNCHANTILGSGEVQRKFLDFQHKVPAYTRRIWETPCGDLTAVDYLPADVPTDRTVVVLHGLESSSDAPLPCKMALAYHRAGFNVAVKLFRGCGGLENRTPKAYHVGFTSDLDFVLQKLREEAGTASPSFYLSGFSLGGNVICKYLGEIGDKALDLGILGAAVTCVPFDCVGCQRKLDGTWFSRSLYSKNFLKTLVPKVEEYLEKFPGAIDLDMERINKVDTIGEFDDLFIAQVFGFKDYVDYYTKNSSKQFLKNVRVPVFALNARDDPFIDENTLPTEADLGEDAPVLLYYTENGGHCGFLHDGYVGSTDRCWLADELATFVSYVDDSYNC